MPSASRIYLLNSQAGRSTLDVLIAMCFFDRAMHSRILFPKNSCGSVSDLYMDRTDRIRIVPIVLIFRKKLKKVRCNAPGDLPYFSIYRLSCSVSLCSKSDSHTCPICFLTVSCRDICSNRWILKVARGRSVSARGTKKSQASSQRRIIIEARTRSSRLLPPPPASP